MVKDKASGASCSIYLQVRDELEQLLDDDDDMADLYLSRKLAGASSPVASGPVDWYPASPTIGSKISRASRASMVTVRGDENDVEELEMLLEVNDIGMLFICLILVNPGTKFVCNIFAGLFYAD